MTVPGGIETPSQFLPGVHDDLLVSLCIYSMGNE